jgi:hypothetical protein
MEILNNPFITSGYIAPPYFCDRERESALLIRELTGGNHVALISTRRMGKSGLIRHCFQREEIKGGYYTFFVDIYPTKSLRDFVFSLSKEIFAELKPKGKKALDVFLQSLKSVRSSLSFDLSGMPSWNIGLGDIRQAEATLDEIFKYLEAAEKPCLVAIDEFQQIAGYGTDNVEATLRTYIQQCRNARFVFSGSQRHTMGNMFTSPARPFYQSVSMLHLESIPPEAYKRFAIRHFEAGDKRITPETIDALYEQFEGITWYMQKLLHTLYDLTPRGGSCDESILPATLQSILESYKYAYQETLFRLPGKQKELLIAITKEGRVKSATSSEFVKKYRLTSASSVQSAMKGLLEKDFVTQELGVYQPYDRFFALWLKATY